MPDLAPPPTARPGVDGTPGPEPAGPLLRVWERRWVRGYVWTGVLAGLLATMPTSLAEIALIPPALFFLPLAHRTWPLWKQTLRRPAFLACMGFYAWLALGLLWSPDRSLGLDELGTARFFALAVLLTPALRTTTTGRRHVIAAVCIGFFVGNIVQLLNAWALHAGGPGALRFGRAPDRMSGWWDPAVAGTILTAAIGMHLPAALMGLGRRRVLGIMGVFATAGGLAMTGSRGGWIASVLLVMGSGLFAMGRASVLGKGRGGTALAFAALVASFLVVGFALRGPIADRIDQARTQVTAAMAGEVSGDTGARLAMKGEAVRAFLAHPLRGVGTGGYRAWIRESRGDDDPLSGFAHAHDTPLHLAASNGIVGVALALAVFVFALLDAARHARRAGMGTWRAGPLFALLGLALTTPFDTLHVSATAASVTGIVFALCLAPPRNDDHEPLDIFADDRIRNAQRGATGKT
jgi:O-antigen ligase